MPVFDDSEAEKGLETLGTYTMRSLSEEGCGNTLTHN